MQPWLRVLRNVPRGCNLSNKYEVSQLFHLQAILAIYQRYKVCAVHTCIGYRHATYFGM